MMMRLAWTADLLASMFLVIVPLVFFKEVSRLTDKYLCKDWVLEKVQDNIDMGGTHKHFQKSKKFKSIQFCPNLVFRFT